MSTIKCKDQVIISVDDRDIKTLLTLSDVTELIKDDDPIPLPFNSKQVKSTLKVLDYLRYTKHESEEINIDNLAIKLYERQKSIDTKNLESILPAKLKKMSVTIGLTVILNAATVNNYHGRLSKYYLRCYYPDIATQLDLVPIDLMPTMIAEAKRMLKKL